jgi:hypothetical protein
LNTEHEDPEEEQRANVVLKANGGKALTQLDRYRIKKAMTGKKKGANEYLYLKGGGVDENGTDDFVDDKAETSSGEEVDGDD